MKQPEPPKVAADEPDPAAVKLPTARKYKRPERKPLSALDEIAPALPADELPEPKYGVKRTGHLRNTFFTPEEQKVYGGEAEPLMDATARLLSSRKTVSPQGKGQSAQQKAKPQEQQPEQAKLKQGSGKKKKKKSAASKPAAKPAQQGTPAASQRLLEPSAKKRRRSHDRPPMQQRSIYGAHKKDSTEQDSSLIKPYYLSDDQ